MLKKIIAIASVLALTAGPILADHHEGEPPPPPSDAPHLLLMPPPGTEKPEDVGEPPPEAEAAKDWLTAIFFEMMDTDDSGGLTEGELRAWVDFAHIPFMPPDGGPMPPDGDGEGDGDGDGGEMWPQSMCGDVMGNEITREISISPGPSNVAISLLAGREAGCFHLEVTGADIETLENEFQIVEEPSTVVWHSMDDGQAAYEALVLTEGIYQVQLLNSGVAEAVFIITFVDYPVSP